MKTLYFLAFMSIALLNAQNKLTSSVYQSFDGTTYTNSSGYDYTYDSNGNLLSETTYFWNGSVWEVYGKTFYTYNALNKVTETIDQWVTNGQLTNSYRSVNTYNPQGQITQITNYQWDSSSGWVNDYKSTISYNGNNFNEIYGYNYSGGTWDDDFKGVCTYTGTLLSKIDNNYWYAGAWNLEDRDVFTYDTNNRKISYKNEEYDGTNWTLYDKEDFVFDANNNTLSEIYSDDFGIYSKYENTYDMSELMASYFHPFKDKSGADYIYQDFPYYNKIVSTQEYGDTSGTLAIIGKTTYNYSAYLGTKESSPSKSSVNVEVYPNPTTDYLNISSNEEISQYEIYSASGRVVDSGKLSKSKSIDVSQLKRGVYFIRLDKTSSSKFIKK